MSDVDSGPVRVEHEGRILTGVGANAEDLQAVLERRAPEPAEDHEPPAAEATAADATADTEKPKSRGAKRFEQLTAERESAKRDADAERQKRAGIEQELAQLRAQLAQREPPAPSPVPAPSPSQTARTKPTEDEIGTKYQTYAEFAEDLADWKVEQRLSKLGLPLDGALDITSVVRSYLDNDRAAAQHQDAVSATVQRGRAAYPDFDQVQTSGPGSQVMLGSSEENAAARVRAILSKPNAEHLVYAIGSDATVAKRLAALSDIDFGIALASLVPSDTTVVSPASTGVRPPVVAPAPYQPVGSGSKTTATPSASLVKGFDYDKSGYREKRAAERGVRRS